MNSDIDNIINSNRDWTEGLESFLNTYQLLYGLPRLENSEQISEAFYNYCLKGRYFIVIALYNSSREFFIQRDFIRSGHQTWELVGGWVQKGEGFDQALDRIVSKETGNTLVEAYPISLVRNTYLTAGRRPINHLGLAYMGRLLQDSNSFQDGAFSHDIEINLNNKDLRILKLGKKILSGKIIEPPVEEVEHHADLGLANKFNRFVIKPISYHFSSKVLQNVILEKVLQLKPSKSLTVLDIACGDDRLVLKLADKVKLVVANDIARSSMQLLIKGSTDKGIVFTNHNLLELKFKIRFDVVICKNVMHHMRNADEMEIMINTLKRLGKRIIIMDIENPKLTLLANAWNYYYVNFLKDHGGLFLSFHQFKSIMEIGFKNTKKIQVSKIKTVKGYYMMAVIDQ
ncbi:methyltransferase domain-containing protein [Candidatus Daviesbacteria bacterium]|nr:methyltransferase domain-containing protein [Candidatus Daviesbacteria bacterium]